MSIYIKLAENKDIDFVIQYLNSRLKESVLYNHAGSKFIESETDSFLIVSELADPSVGDFDFSIGVNSAGCKKWIMDESLRYLNNPGAVVIFEDMISYPTDGVIATRDHPLLWHYGCRVFWPVECTNANDRHIEDAMGWNSGFHEMIFFSQLPINFSSDHKTRRLNENELVYFSKSVQMIVVDIYDGEGYLVWNRKIGREKFKGDH